MPVKTGLFVFGHLIITRFGSAGVGEANCANIQ